MPGNFEEPPGSFADFNRIPKVNLQNLEELQAMAFKMAAFDVIQNSELYRSNVCSHDLYYTGHDRKDLPQSTPNPRTSGPVAVEVHRQPPLLEETQKANPETRA